MCKFLLIFFSGFKYETAKALRGIFLMQLVALALYMPAMAQPTPAELPYAHDFEDAAENERWTLLNEEQTNKWFIGTAEKYSGDRSLYVSFNDGATRHYRAGGESDFSYVYAYRRLNFPEIGSYFVSFVARADGRVNSDKRSRFSDSCRFYAGIRQCLRNDGEQQYRAGKLDCPQRPVVRF